MAVGNDVVDLTDPETDLRALHPRFAERVFSPAERDALAACEREPVARRHGSTAREAPARTLLHWALWAAKESAYKALQRLAPGTLFSPREFEVDLPSASLLATTGAIEGSVLHRGRRFSLRVHRDGACLHAIVGSADLAGRAILSRVGAAAWRSQRRRAPTRRPTRSARRSASTRRTCRSWDDRQRRHTGDARCVRSCRSPITADSSPSPAHCPPGSRVSRRGMLSPCARLLGSLRSPDRHRTSSPSPRRPCPRLLPGSPLPAPSPASPRATTPSRSLPATTRSPAPDRCGATTGSRACGGERRSAWAQRVDQDRHAVVFLGDSITQGWGDDLGGAFPGSEGREPRHQRRHDARRPAQARCRRARARSGRRRAADRHERPRGRRTPDVAAGNLEADPGRPRAARAADADRALSGVPELGDQEASGGADPGAERALPAQPSGTTRASPTWRPGRSSPVPTATRPPRSSPICCTRTPSATASGPQPCGPSSRRSVSSRPTPDPFLPSRASRASSMATTSPAGAIARRPRRTRRATRAGGRRIRTPPSGRSSPSRPASTGWRSRPTDASRRSTVGSWSRRRPSTGRSSSSGPRASSRATSCSSSSSAPHPTPTAASTCAALSSSAGTTGSPGPTRT